MLIAFTATGCAAPAPEYAPFTGVPPGSAIQVEPFAGITQSGPPDSKVGERASEGAVMGAAAGAQAGYEMGFGAAGSDCGEFFLVCLALLPVMATAGLVGGAIVGTGIGMIEDLPYESTQAMEEVISGYFEQAPPNPAFSEQFIETAKPDWRLDPAAPNRITVAVIGVRAKKDKGETLLFEVTTAMKVDYGVADAPSTKPYHLTEATTAYEIDEWLAGGQELFGKEIDSSFARSATVFTTLLKNPPRRR